MRLRISVFSLSFVLILAAVACTSKPSSDNSNTTTGASSSNAANPNATSPSAAMDNNQTAQRNEVPKPPLVVPSGTAVTVRLGNALGSKLSKPGETFTGTLEKGVVVENTVAIPRGVTVTGTVVDAKPLGKFAGGARLEIRIDHIYVNGSDLPVHASARSFTVKGKGKRTAVIAGGGAALGGLIGGLAGGGKGAAIGLAAGGGAGGAGAAFTGNHEVVLPAESAVTFQLTRAIDIRQ
jgi:hypothetical protein